MKAIIISDGIECLKPLTYTKPEPVIPIAGRPMIGHMLDHLQKHFITDISLTMDVYHSEELTEYFETDNQFDFLYLDDIFCATTNIRKNSKYIDDTIVLFQGDILTNINLCEMMSFHKKSGALLTVALSKAGDFCNNNEAGFEEDEKPDNLFERSNDYRIKGLTNTGVYIIEPEAMDHMIKNTFFSPHEKLAFPLDKNEISYFMDDTFCIKINNMNDYMNANHMILENSNKQISSDIIGEVYGDVNIGENTEIGESIIMGPTWIGDDVEIEDNCFIGPYSCIGNGTHIGGNCDIGKSVLFEDVYIGKKTNVRDSIVGEYCVIGNNAFINRSTIGGYCQLGNFVEMTRQSSLWPFSYIREFSTVDGVLKRFVSANCNCEYTCILTEEESFYFNTREGTKIVSTGISANNIFDFLDILKTVDKRSIEYHLQENINDFAQWSRLIFNDNRLADEIEAIYEDDKEARAKLIELFSSRVLGIYNDDKELIENAHCAA